MKPLNRCLSIVFIVFLPLLVALVVTPLHATPTDTSPPTQIHAFDDLPQGLAYAISSTLQDKLPSTYSLNRVPSGFCAKNTAHGMNLTFTDKGPLLTNNTTTWHWSMTLTGWGRGKLLRKTPSATLTATGPRMEYKRGASLTEWYINTPWGLEQGFTINNKPSTPKDLPSSLILELTLSGSLQPALKGKTLQLSDHTGQTRIRYTGLYAFDTEGKTLTSRLSLKGDTLRILIDDSSASYPITIDPWVQKNKLTASDGAADDEFGVSVSISGEMVVVGAYGDNIDAKTDQGSAYVFEKLGNSWTQTAKLTAGDSEVYDHFGTSVSISGWTVVVGAYGANTNQGLAYVFEKPFIGGWITTSTYDAKLTASDGTAGDYFGWSVSISGDTVVVGAYNDSVGGKNDQGSVYLYENKAVFWSNTPETAKLTASDGAADDYFGVSVSISGDTVVVGAYGDNNNKGSAYVFEKPFIGDWQDTSTAAKITASDGAANDYFGVSVAISGDTVVIGAPHDNIEFWQGSVYVFSKPIGGWITTSTYNAKLTASDGAAGDEFGKSVSISGDTVVVGTNYDDDKGADSGSAYVFQKLGGGWATTSAYNAKLTASDGAADDEFGYSVSISGDTVVIGARFDDIDIENNQGSAYVFKLTPSLAPILMLLMADGGG